MKIIIELEGPGGEQPEVKKVISIIKEENPANLSTSISSSPIDAGQAPLQNATTIYSPAISSTSQGNPQGNVNAAPTGTTDAGSANVLEESLQTIMPGTGSTNALDKNNAYTAGSFAHPGPMNN